MNIHSVYIVPSIFLFFLSLDNVEMEHHIRKKVFAVAILLLVIGGLNIGFMTAFKKDILTTVFGKHAMLTNVLFVCIGLSAAYIGFFRDSYLPFLGPSIMPCALLTPQVPAGADFAASVSLRPGSKVLYWAAEPANRDLQFVEDWQRAYSDFKNAGVAVADGQGKATLAIRKPRPYTVPIMGELTPHIHYRICEERGQIGAVRTVTFDGKEYFENVVAAQEHPEPVLNSPPAPTIPTPENAMKYMNAIAAETLRNSKMVESGAPDEFRPGASLQYAFA